MRVVIQGVIGVLTDSVTKDNCAKIYTVILQCVGKKQIFAKRVDWEVPEMIGILGEFRIKVMLGRSVLCGKKNERMVKKFF